MPSRPDRTTGPTSLAIWSGIWVLYLVWGSTYLGIAVAIDTIPPFLMAAIRFAIAGAVLLAWAVLRDGRDFRLPTRPQLRDSVVVAALLLGSGMGMVAVGEQTVPSGLTAIFIAMMPLWIAVFGRLFFGERLPTIALLGIGLGLGGIVVLAWPGDASLAGVEPIHLAAVIVSPISWSLGSLYAAHKAHLPERPAVASGVQMVAGSIVLGAMALVAGEPTRFAPADISTASLTALLYLIFVGSVFAFSVYGWLLRVAPLPKIATYAYVNPIVAVILGALILDEPITPRTLVAGGIVIAAVALIVTTRGRTAAQPDAPAEGPAGAPADAARTPSTPSTPTTPTTATGHPGRSTTGDALAEP
jgi:drug/metabolite transporter (DMT)-like permease